MELLKNSSSTRIQGKPYIMLELQEGKRRLQDEKEKKKKQEKRETKQGVNKSLNYLNSFTLYSVVL